MKYFTLLLAICLWAGSLQAQISIAQARLKGEGATVTVKGIVTNGSELGVIRYLQDKTGGIAAYGTVVSDLKRGDSILITGTLVDYNQLLEMNPITSITVINSGNTLPAPVVLTPSQIGEAYEGMLVKINKALFAAGGNTFSSKKGYSITSGGQSTMVYSSSSSITGQMVPADSVNVIAICSQFDYSVATIGYQLLPRDMDDLELISSIFFKTVLKGGSVKSDGVDLTWTTNIAGSTEVKYGRTPALEMTPLKVSGDASTSHSISITGMNPGDIIYANAFSVSGSDTAYSQTKTFATISNSTGNIKVYFNHPVDTTVKKWQKAVYLNELIDDTLINYINRAKYTIDFTIYNFDNSGLSNIGDALKAAANRGVTVRVIGCGTTTNNGIDELIGSAVHLLKGPDKNSRNGIMHNKFVVFDANSSNANEPIVWTGSTNFTDGQINTDANNVIIFQDQSLARAYTIEFEEMWGSSIATANSSNAKFGEHKLDNTPHEFIIGGKRIECYFSPSDGVNDKIISTINTANSDLSIATMLCTRTEIGTAIVNAHSGGAVTNMLTSSDQKSSTYDAVNGILNTGIGTHFVIASTKYVPGIMHHKYFVVDQSNTKSDPLVLTGSHNWSAAANTSNDENTVIVHDSIIANLYYQSFVKEYTSNHGSLDAVTTPPVALADVDTIIKDATTISVLDNDVFSASVTLQVVQVPGHGTAVLNYGGDAITYKPLDGFVGIDTFTYRVAYELYPTLADTASVIVHVVGEATSVHELSEKLFSVYPNPFSNELNLVSSKGIATAQMVVTNLTGKEVYRSTQSLSKGSNALSLPEGLQSGVYLLNVADGSSIITLKLIKK